jgi:hypothetical protein
MSGCLKQDGSPKAALYKNSKCCTCIPCRSGVYVQSCVKPAELLDRVGDSCSDRGGIRAVSLNGNSATADILNRSRCLARCHLS